MDDLRAAAAVEVAGGSRDAPEALTRWVALARVIMGDPGAAADLKGVCAVLGYSLTSCGMRQGRMCVHAFYSQQQIWRL